MRNGLLRLLGLFLLASGLLCFLVGRDGSKSGIRQGTLLTAIAIFHGIVAAGLLLAGSGQRDSQPDPAAAPLPGHPGHSQSATGAAASSSDLASRVAAAYPDLPASFSRDEVYREVLGQIAGGNLIAGIKTIREDSGIGLFEAKTRADRIKAAIARV
ncbi:MAG: hypothetical protein NTY38_31475 [Acidobacteria bacterium]|nr:hypothetical protein [Acidobacteriota bacterium]